MTLQIGVPAGIGRSDVAAAIDVAVMLARNGATNAGDLGEQLYSTWYARPATADPAGRAPSGFPDDLAAVFRAAHAAANLWEDGWIVERVGPAGMVEVVRGAEHRVLYRVDYVVPEHPGLSARIGDSLHATARRDIVDPDRSWWRTRGAAWMEASPPPQLVRLYWDTRLEGVPRLITLLTSVLDRLDGPWAMKCALNPDLQNRPDANVAYIAGPDLAAIAAQVEGIRSVVEDAARGTRPPFTLPIGPGLAIAEDPGRQQSFGEHRCRLVAEGVLEAAPSFAEMDVAAAVAARFDKAGIDPRRPWAATPALLTWELA
jgi:hypothetical protein